MHPHNVDSLSPASCVPRMLPSGWGARHTEGLHCELWSALLLLEPTLHSISPRTTTNERGQGWGGGGPCGGGQVSTRSTRSGASDQQECTCQGWSAFTAGWASVAPGRWAQSASDRTDLLHHTNHAHTRTRMSTHKHTRAHTVTHRTSSATTCESHQPRRNELKVTGARRRGVHMWHVPWDSHEKLRVYTHLPVEALQVSMVQLLPSSQSQLVRQSARPTHAHASKRSHQTL